MAGLLAVIPVVAVLLVPSLCPGLAPLALPVTAAQRSTAFAAVATQETALGDAVTPKDLAIFAAARSEFEAAGYNTTDGSGWARFTDGRIAVFPGKRTPGPPRQLPATRQRAGGHELPDNANCYLFDAMGTAFSHPSPMITQYLAFRKYNIVGNTSTIEGLKAVSNAGIFYMDAHGGTGKARSNSELYSIWTGSSYSYDGEAAYGEDLDDGRIVYMYASHNLDGNNKAIPEWHYAVTSLFVSRYMSFAQNSIVFINACSSDNATFKLACENKGAGLYLGWTTPVPDVSAYDAALFFFDRLTGADSFERPDPPNRPFDFRAVQEAMHQQAYDTGVLDGVVCTLIMTPSSGSEFAILTPNIKYMEVDEVANTLTLHGIFGTKRGTAYLAGAPMGVQSWDDEEIVCQLPPDKGGEVYVEIDQHRSNFKKVTMWHGTFTFNRRSDYTFTTPESVNTDVTFDVRFRADVGSYRDRPDGDVVLPNLVPFTATKSCKATFKTAGTVTYQNDASALIKTTYSGNGTISNVITDIGDDMMSALLYRRDEYMTCFGFVNVEAMTMTVCLAQFSPNGNSKMDDTIYAPPPLPNIHNVTDEPWDIMGFSEGPIPGIEMYKNFPGLLINLQQDFSIPGDNRTGTQKLNDKTTETESMKWSTITPDSPPLSSDKRTVKIR